MCHDLNFCCVKRKKRKLHTRRKHLQSTNMTEDWKMYKELWKVSSEITVLFNSGQKARGNMSLKGIYRWQISTWKDVPHHRPQGDANEGYKELSYMTVRTAKKHDSDCPQHCGRGCWWECKLGQRHWESPAASSKLNIYCRMIYQLSFWVFTPREMRAMPM